jgi:hypothetical protein
VTTIPGRVSGSSGVVAQGEPIGVVNCGQLLGVILVVAGLAKDDTTMSGHQT